MASPLSPAIDADVCDEDIFDSPADKQAAGFGDDDEDDSVIDDSSTVVGAINEEEEIDQDNYPEIVIWENSLLRPTVLNGGKMISRRIVLPGSYWNLGKTGGDTLTRLFDEADARGLDTENNVATARVFMYAAAAIHRLHQYTTATRNVSDYPTIQHQN